MMEDFGLGLIPVYCLHIRFEDKSGDYRICAICKASWIIGTRSPDIPIGFIEKPKEKEK